MKETLEFNGHRFNTSTDFTALIRGQLLGDARLSGRYDESADEGAWSLFAAAKGTPFERLVLQSVKNLLLDPDKTVRSGAVRLAQAFADRYNANDLLGILDGNPALFSGVTDGSLSGIDLSWGLLRAIAGAQGWTEPVAARIRSAVIDPAHGALVLAALVDHEPDWVIENVQNVIAGQPARAEVILFRMREPSLREKLVRAVPRESPRLRSIMSQAVDKEVRDGPEKTRLLGFLKEG